MKLICIKCPRGCELDVDGDKIFGNLCPRGVEYAKEEQVSPKRIVTALAKMGKFIVPVKTNIDVPKDRIFDVLEEISKLNLDTAKIGDIVIENCLGLGVDIVVTGYPYQSN